MNHVSSPLQPFVGRLSYPEPTKNGIDFRFFSLPIFPGGLGVGFALAFVVKGLRKGRGMDGEVGWMDGEVGRVFGLGKEERDEWGAVGGEVGFWKECG